MKCLNCAFDNPDEARFCQNCGKPLELRCPSCGTVNASQAKFCMNCGTSLQRTPEQSPPHSSITPGVSIPVTAAPVSEILITRPRPAEHLLGERRVVTVLFADVVGSTSLAEQMDPEDWAAVMNRAFEALTPAIYRYGGTIARLMGDALLAFFGAPVAHEDDPRRAGRAALELIEAAQSYAEQLRGQYGIDFAIRVGVNTGMAVVGEVGSNLASEYTAMGDAVNLAARIQAAARPMSVLISDHTHDLLSGDFECEDLGQIPIRGKAEPVHVFELRKPKAQTERLWGGTGLQSAMVGRDSDLVTLLKAGEAVSAGLGRVVLVLGDPGIGKTRLISEWKARLDPSGSSLGWSEGRTLSYGQGMAYHLLVDLLYSLTGLPPGSEEPAVRKALGELCASLFGDAAANTYPYLGHLLSLHLEPDALERVHRLDPQALQSQYLTALRALLLGLAARRPQVIVLEDIHWADPSSVDLIAKLLPLSFEAPLLFCLVARVDRDAPGWKLVAQAREQLGASLSEINLRSLSDQDTRQMIANLLQDDAFPAELRSLVLSKAEGNPLFVEEVVRMLLDRKLILRTESGWEVSREIENIEIPDNLQSLLLARIDRLPEDVKRTLRVAAVIGRQFSIHVLQEVLKKEEGSA